MTEQLTLDLVCAPPIPLAPGQGAASSETFSANPSTPLQGAVASPACEPPGAPHPVPATLAELKALLRERDDGSRKTRDMCSALVTTARVLGMPLEAISTCAAQLVPLLAHANPQALGVKPPRWSRVKSLLLSALLAGGLDVLPGRDLQGLSDQWRELAERLPDKASRVAQSRLLSHFSRLGIAPKDVTEADLLGFEETLKTRSLRANPVQTFRSSMRAWNAATAIPGWPDVHIELEPDGRHYSLPLEDFQSSLPADFENFQAHSIDPDPFAETFYRPVRPETQHIRRKQFHQLASALVLSGFPISSLTSLKVLVQPANAKAALRYLLARRGGKTGVHLEGQARLLRTIARHWVRDELAADALDSMCRGLHVQKAGMAPKNRNLLRQFDLPDNVQALLTLPHRVFTEARRAKGSPGDEALRVMRAFAVEILLIAPMRVKNLTQIEIGRHLVEHRRGKNKRYHLIFTPEETKTREPYEMELPPQTAVLLEIYLERYRPRLCGGPSPYLFAGGDGEGGERSSKAFSPSLKRFVKAETGLKMHAHLFRQFAGKFYLDHYPMDVETLRRVLGHRSTATTLRSYAQLRTDHAFRRYDELVESSRSSHLSRTPKKSKAPLAKPKGGR